MIINQYRAIYKNDKNENVIKYVNASSMIKAIELLNTDNGEPINILLQEKNILTEENLSTTVNLKTICVDINDEELENCNVYPTELNDLNRGTTLYLTAVPQEEYQFVKWILPNEEESTDNPLFVTTTNDESITEINYKAIFKNV